MNATEVKVAFALLAERDRLHLVQSSDNCGLGHVGVFIDAEAVKAVLPSYAAEISRRIAGIEDQLSALGVTLSAWDDYEAGMLLNANG